MERASQINSRGRHRVASYLADEEGMLRISREAAVEQPVAQHRPSETVMKQLVAATVRAALDFRRLCELSLQLWLRGTKRACKKNGESRRLGVRTPPRRTSANEMFS